MTESPTADGESSADLRRETPPDEAGQRLKTSAPFAPRKWPGRASKIELHSRGRPSALLLHARPAARRDCIAKVEAEGGPHPTLLPHHPTQNLPFPRATTHCPLVRFKPTDASIGLPLSLTAGSGPGLPLRLRDTRRSAAHRPAWSESPGGPALHRSPRRGRYGYEPASAGG